LLFHLPGFEPAVEASAHLIGDVLADVVDHLAALGVLDELGDFVADGALLGPAVLLLHFDLHVFAHLRYKMIAVSKEQKLNKVTGIQVTWVYCSVMVSKMCLKHGTEISLGSLKMYGLLERLTP
jgi:hypothetical protein